MRSRRSWSCVAGAGFDDAVADEEVLGLPRRPPDEDVGLAAHPANARGTPGAPSRHQSGMIPDDVEAFGDDAATEHRAVPGGGTDQWGGRWKPVDQAARHGSPR